jgi:hypothetical protein
VISIVDSGDKVLLNLTVGTVACSQLLHERPRSDASKCIQVRKEPTFNYIADNQEPDCSVSYARNRKLNVFCLCLVSCRTVRAQQFVDRVRNCTVLQFYSLLLTDLSYLKSLYWFRLTVGLAFEGL